MEGRTHLHGHLLQSLLETSLRKGRKLAEDRFKLSRYELAHSESELGGILTSIFLSSMALGSLMKSRPAERAEYSMLKGRPVPLSVSSLIALSLESV